MTKAKAKAVAVGDFIIWEGLCGLSFEFGEVIGIVEDHLVVQTGWIIRTIRSDWRDQIMFVGEPKEVVAMMDRIKAMKEERNNAIKAAEDEKSKIAGEHAKRIRTLLKLKPKRRARHDDDHVAG